MYFFVSYVSVKILNFILGNIDSMISFFDLFLRFFQLIGKPVQFYGVEQKKCQILKCYSEEHISIQAGVDFLGQLDIKGQLISKCLFGVLKFFQKHFLEELRIPKSPFEITWPLVGLLVIMHDLIRTSREYWKEQKYWPFALFYITNC